MTRTGRAPDVVVVGAGIVGAAIARELSLAGLAVLVIDEQPPGLVASSRCMGHIVALDESDELLRFSAAGVRSWQALASELPKQAQYHKHGTLWLQEELDESAAQQKLALLESVGMDCEWVDGAALCDLEPGLRSGLAGAVRAPEDASVYPPVVARHWILEASPRASISFQQDEVVELGSGYVKVKSGALYHSAHVVIAAGLASARAFAGLPKTLRPVPRKGHLLVTQVAGIQCHHQLLEMAYTDSVLSEDAVSVAFNVQPRPRGQLILGSSRSYRGDRDIEPAVVGRILARARAFLPGLAESEVLRVWAGLRPASPLHRPVIGPHPRWSGVWLAIGHEGLGVTTAPVTAQILRAAIMGDAQMANTFNADHFLPPTEEGDASPSPQIESHG